MAESMRGLKRTYRCGEVTEAHIGEDGNLNGLGPEKKKSGKPDFCGLKRPVRADADCI